MKRNEKTVIGSTQHTICLDDSIYLKKMKAGVAKGNYAPADLDEIRKRRAARFIHKALDNLQPGSAEYWALLAKLER
ncbi:hypothetical protein Lepto7375DRAFT_0592 [Leptolyngbya sp. PCC 7375]|nr:hypothetical protein Lepto7375DRAFT_0592 [Leptolyngbya sp. PCC 7375]